MSRTVASLCCTCSTTTHYYIFPDCILLFHTYPQFENTSNQRCQSPVFRSWQPSLAFICVPYPIHLNQIVNYIPRVKLRHTMIFNSVLLKLRHLKAGVHWFSRTGVWKLCFRQMSYFSRLCKNTYYKTIYRKNNTICHVDLNIAGLLLQFMQRHIPIKLISVKICSQ